MNGATADPCVSTIRPPNSRRTRTIGSSQNFFRSLMNVQSSRTNSPIARSLLPWKCSSELPGHVGGGSGRLGDAVRRRIGLEAPVHRISPEPPHEDAHRRHERVEDDGEDDARVDPPQGLSYRHPAPVDIGQAAGQHEGRNDQRHRERERPESRPLGAKEDGPEADRGEDAADDQAEVSELFLLVLMSHEVASRQSSSNSFRQSLSPSSGFCWPFSSTQFSSTSKSSSVRMKQRYASAGVQTIGSPRTLNEVFTMTPHPVFA